MKLEWHTSEKVLLLILSFMPAISLRPLLTYASEGRWSNQRPTANVFFADIAWTQDLLECTIAWTDNIDLDTSLDQTY